MAEQMIVHEPGDRYITLNSEGRATIWVIQSDGRPKPEGQAPESMTEPELQDMLARTIAKAQDADYWADDIVQWEQQQDWEREAYTGEYPSMAYEDRENYRKVAQAVIDEYQLSMGTLTNLDRTVRAHLISGRVEER